MNPLNKRNEEVAKQRIMTNYLINSPRVDNDCFKTLLEQFIHLNNGSDNIAFVCLLTCADAFSRIKTE